MSSRKLLGILVGAVAALGAGAASAADLPATAYKAPPMVAPAFDWTGFYIGANFGYGWGRDTISAFGISGTENMNGVLGGGQVGYNWQTGNWILGIEVDAQGTDQNATTIIPGATGTDSMPWFVTARGRVGYAIAPMWMIYATAGGAWADFKSSLTVGGLGTFSSESSHGGWTAGAGFENAINRQWSWKVEYLHFDTGSFGISFVGLLPANVKMTDDVLRFGANFRF